MKEKEKKIKGGSGVRVTGDASKYFPPLQNKVERRENNVRLEGTSSLTKNSVEH